MTFGDWVEESRDRIAADGLAGVHPSMYELYVGMWRTLGRRYNYGRNIFDDSWDVVVILDACRWDLMREVEASYEFVDDTADYSIASSSGEWIPKTFDDVDTSDVAYVTANPFSKMLLDGGDFLVLDEVWDYAVDEEIRTIPADAVTDRGIHTYRNADPEKLILHYMQPHYPFVPSPMDRGLPLHDFGQSPWSDVWDRLQAGEVTYDDVWQNYRANLEYVLDSVAILLDNVDGEVLITADHGNLLGEFGLYGHPDHVPLPALKRVPWCKTSATDNRSHEPKEWKSSEEAHDREDLLRDLGYR
ncbi:hypothetical protein Hbl1158_06870 [Halobaculum sp. CBA1158]|uniref:hypothetical protein n=1 Tax=Halobaculum sp. CBA1158 TaxID=2904243 RepID=UPI001F26D1B3|nr:hypothetical protein [Halobaculum sp. CBA1158]UIP01068.1 hypothetical protein Hbl1158_06870 [Halobaculum sp. CBA1158]